jgi:hypothetical protein
MKRKEAAVVYLRFYSGMLLEGLRKLTNISFRIAVVSAEIRTQHLPNTSIEPYAQNNLFDVTSCRLAEVNGRFGGTC